MNSSHVQSKNKIIILITIALSSFLTAFSTYTTVISAKKIGIELNMDVITLSWVTNIFILATAMFQLFFGKIGDIHGRKKVFLTGVVIFTITSIFLALTPSSVLFIVLRFIQGTGAALLYATSNAILTSIYPPDQRGKAIGGSVTGVYIGLTLSPLLGGIMTEYLGWRSQFWFNIPFGIIIILLILFGVKGEWRSDNNEKIDYIGSLIFAVLLFFLIYATTLFPNVLAYLFILISLIGVIIFYFWEKKIINPLLDISLFRSNRYFSFSCLVSIFFYISTIAIALVLSLFIQYIYDLTPTQTGYILLIAPLTQAIITPFMGWLSDKVEARKLVSMGIIIALSGLFILIFINVNFPLFLVGISLGILGIGTALFSSPNIRAIMSSIPKSHLGIANGLEGTMRTIGQSLSFGIWTLITGILIGNVTITATYYPQFLISARLVFIIFFFLIFISIIFSLLRGKNKIDESNFLYL